MAELKDKTDFEKYRQQQTGGFQWNDLTSQPHLTQIIQQLLQLMQQNNGQQDNRGGMRPQQQRRYQNNGQGRGNYQQNPMGGQGMPQAMPQAPMMGGQPGMPGRPQQPMQPGAPAGGMPQPGMAPMGNMDDATKFQQDAARLLPAVQERNQYLKEQVGHLIYDFVQKIIGVEKAPKITGMLIELPVPQIREYLASLDALKVKVAEANNLLEGNQQ